MILMIILILSLVSFLFWLGFHITGALLTALVWVVIKLPAALILFSLGLACCVTLLLIPVGMSLFRTGVRILC